MKKSKQFFIENGKVYIAIPVKNKGKFRWKNRKDLTQYGNGFSTDKIPYTEDSYVEWQIGYDVPVKDFKKDPEAKPTVLNDWVFINQKDIEKHPYELSEYLVAMIEAGIVSKNEISNLISSIEKSKISLEEDFKIQIAQAGNYSVDDITFMQNNITLPTFVYSEKDGKPFIEISIQKQQYASGVQPMLYFCVPIKSLKDFNDMIGKTAKELKFTETYFVVDQSNKNVILNMFRFFAICSDRHKHDIDEILKLIEQYVDSLN